MSSILFVFLVHCKFHKNGGDLSFKKESKIEDVRYHWGNLRLIEADSVKSVASKTKDILTHANVSSAKVTHMKTCGIFACTKRTYLNECAHVFSDVILAVSRHGADKPFDAHYY